MVPCKYFLEGNCRYGSSCRYDHSSTVYGEFGSDSKDFSVNKRPMGKSILKGHTSSFEEKEFDHDIIRSSHQNYSSQAPGLKYNVYEIMHIVSKDTLQSEKGNQWPLSCYSPHKDFANFPGLEDHSPEELRWECYKAVQNATLPLCQAIMQQLYANAAKINNELKKKDTAYTVIDRWLRSQEEFLQTNVSSDSPSTLSNTVQFLTSTGMQNMQTTSNDIFTLSLPQQQGNIQTLPPNASKFVNYQTTSSDQLGPPPRQTDINPMEYSAVEDLTEAEVETFKMDRFSLGSIPTKPPPKRFCH